MNSKKIVGVVVLCGGVLGLTSPTEVQGQACSECGPGAHWIDGCAAGSDEIATQQAVVGIDLDLDCVEDTSFVLNPCGLFTVVRSDPVVSIYSAECKPWSSQTLREAIRHVESCL